MSKEDFIGKKVCVDLLDGCRLIGVLFPSPAGSLTLKRKTHMTFLSLSTVLSVRLAKFSDVEIPKTPH
ncbi:MAG: hypothetical protein K2P90_01400 [Holosporales bacterium]|nr:hypothetical protein [Holosporales bacterium]